MIRRWSTKSGNNSSKAPFYTEALLMIPLRCWLNVWGELISFIPLFWSQRASHKAEKAIRWSRKCPLSPGNCQYRSWDRSNDCSCYCCPEVFLACRRNCIVAAAKINCTERDSCRLKPVWHQFFFTQHQIAAGHLSERLKQNAAALILAEAVCAWIQWELLFLCLSWADAWDTLWN